MLILTVKDYEKSKIFYSSDRKKKKGRIIFEITSFPKTKQKFYSFQNCNSQKELILLNYL